jgi:tetratricopeptide (TPR) repeat protein
VAIGLLPRYFARNADKSAAAKTLEQALASELNSEATGGAAWTAVGWLRQAAADMTGTVDAIRRAAELTPMSEDPIYLALTLTGNAAQVTQSQVDKFMSGTTTAELRMAYARTLLDRDRSADAYAQCVLINQQKPSLADAWLVRGSLEAQEKRWNDASTSLKRYISVLTEQADGTAPKETGRGWAQGHILLAQIADINSQPQEALAYLAQIDSPQDAMRVLKLRTTILAKQGKLAEARQVIRNAPETSEGDDRAKRGIEIQLLRDHQQFAEAYTLLEHAIAKYPQDYDFAYDQAMVAEKLGKLVEMEQILRRIIAAKPDYHHAYNALGYSFAERNIRLPEARQLIDQALKSAPNDPYILDSLAWVEFRSGNNAEALRILQNAYKTRPDAEIAAHLGEVLWVMGQRNEALDIWRQGTQLNPDNATLQETIARLTRKP